MRLRVVRCVVCCIFLKRCTSSASSLRKGGLFLRTKRYHWSIFKKLILIRSELIAMKLVKSFLKIPPPYATNRLWFLAYGGGTY